MEKLELTKSLPSYFKGKKVLLTGHTGFKGTWMLHILHRFGAEVTGYALAPEYGENSFYHQMQSDNICSSIIGDIRDKEHFQECILEANAEIIFHMAAQPLVLASYQDPVGTYATNVWAPHTCLMPYASIKSLVLW
jgi:CDP-glucose 4,6-dehydratase